jgi:hypothetical protein
MNVWPFMFAASKASDYQFVVLPDIFDASNCDALRDRLEIDDTDPRKTRTASLSIKEAGNVSCVYRAGPIVVDNEIRTDSAGRKLLFAFGVVTKEISAASSLEKLSDLIDASQPLFERGLLSFLNSDKGWIPLVARTIKLDEIQGESGLDQVRKVSNSTIFLSIALLISFGACAFLYSKILSLESQLSTYSSRPSPQAAADTVAKSPEPTAGSPETPPNSPPHPRENELETRGPLTIERPRP